MEIRDLEGRMLLTVPTDSLRGANLRGADLYRADLYRADLRGVNLRKADLRKADLYGADLYGADLRGADFHELTLQRAKFVSGLYKYICAGIIDQTGEKWVMLGCHTRKVEDWENDFWNNDREFPNDGSIESQLRVLAYETCKKWTEITSEEQ